MKRITIAGILIVLALAVLGFILYKHGFAKPPVVAPAAVPAVLTPDVAQTPVLPLTQKYANKTFGFSFNYPDDYQTHEDMHDNETDVLIQSADGTGIQIIITPYDDPDSTITPDTIHASIPDLAVNDPQNLDLGTGGSAGKGIAFRSDNAAFDGNSREVWFVYKGNLYQISTYARYDDFLKAIFGTWKFN